MRYRVLRRLAVLSLLAVCAAAPAAESAQQLRTRVNMLAPDLGHGAQLFERCAACHASDGGGVEDGSVPDIAGQHRSVLVKQVVDYRFARRWDPRMEAIAGEHLLGRPQDIADVTAFIASLPFRDGAGHGDGKDVAHGEQVYADLCASCHGPRAGGDESRGIPRLAGQHYDYLRRQLYDAVDRRRPNFTADHVRLLKRFERADFAGVSDYLSRLEDGAAGPR